MGPLLFLVMLVPFTLNGLAVREAFFVSFLGSSASTPTRRSPPASSSSSSRSRWRCPGGLILLWEGLRGRPRRASTDA